MAYSKQTWSSNELVTADKLNHIEDGIPTKTSQLTNDSGFLTSHQSIAGKKNTQSAVSSPSASGTAVAFIDTISQDAQGVITPTKKTVATVTTSTAGLMSAEDKTKLNGIASGAQVNSITGVKGNAESSYRTGNVNLTPANIGALPTTGGDMTAGIRFMDSSSRPVGGINYVHDSNGTDRTFLVARTADQSNNIQLGVKCNSNNTLDYWITDPAKFRQDAGITPANIGAVATSDIIDVSHGGTGATTPENAQTNLEIFYLLDYDTWSNTYSKLSKISPGRSAFVWVGDSGVMRLLTGEDVSFGHAPGIVTKIDTQSTYRFNIFWQGGIYSWNVSNLSATSGTPGPIYASTPRTQTMNFTTDSNGNHNLNLKVADQILLSAWAPGVICMPYVTQSGGYNSWAVHVAGVNGSSYSSQNITLHVALLDGGWFSL